MSDQPISRRHALIAATALGAMAAVSQADDPARGQPFEAVAPKPDPKAATTFALQVTLTDGQVVTLNASKAVITFSDGGALVATPAGVLPFRPKLAKPVESFGSEPAPFDPPRDKTSK
jgi:hypothetical protein